MTVGLYVNVGHHIIITDCLQTSMSGGKQIYSPSNIENFDGSNGELAELVSKFFYPDDQTIITFAGKSDHIGIFVNNFPTVWAERDKDLRPMEFLQITDYNLRGTRNSWNCAVLGTSIMPTTDTEKRALANNYASEGKNWSFSTRHFGKCFAIGSGAGAFRRLIENADQKIADVGGNVQELLGQLLGALNGRVLFFQHFDKGSDTWGGLLQAQIYSNETRRWMRTPNWFHCCLMFKGQNLDYVGSHPKVVFHTSKPGTENTSGVDTWVKTEKSGDMICFWPIYSPFSQDRENNSILQNEMLALPDQITVSVFIDIDGKQSTHHYTNTAKIFKEISFEQYGEHFAYSIDAASLSASIRERMLAGKKFW